MTIDRLAYRPLRRSTRLAPLITAIGVSFMLENIALVWKGPAPFSYPDIFPSVDILYDWLGLELEDLPDHQGPARRRGDDPPDARRSSTS